MSDLPPNEPNEEVLSIEEFRWVLAMLQNMEWSRKDSNVPNLITLAIHIPSSKEAIEARESLESLRVKLESLIIEPGEEP